MVSTNPTDRPAGDAAPAGAASALDERAAISVRDLRKVYGKHEAVRGISFDVTAGEVFGFLGPNGAGKTTTIEILEGYRRRTAGQVRVLGVDPGRPTRRWRERIGLVLQEQRARPQPDGPRDRGAVRQLLPGAAAGRRDHRARGPR